MAWTEQVRRGADVARERLNNPAFLPFIGDLRDQRVLDAGCGEGSDTRILARADARMTGVDISPRMIELAGDLTKGAHWIRDEQGVKVKWAVSGYFDPRHWVERWRFTDASAEAPEFTVPRCDRTLSQYLNGVMDAGFVLRRVEEPRPSEEYCQAHPSQRGWRDHAALFFYVRAQKPR